MYGTRTCTVHENTYSQNDVHYYTVTCNQHTCTHTCIPVHMLYRMYSTDYNYIIFLLGIF